MKWANIWLIFQRELRDQLRDRRTVFTIALLPLLLYPLLGISFFQMAQFQREHVSRIWVVGASELPQDPVLIDGEHFSESTIGEENVSLAKIVVDDAIPATFIEQDVATIAKREIEAGTYDAVIYFPEHFGHRLETFQQQLVRTTQGEAFTTEQLAEVQPPRPEVYVNLANDKSKIASDRISGVMRTWRESIVQETLVESNLPRETIKPFLFVTHDVSRESTRRAAFWAKLLPFVLLVWALTGAFYPAVDLCAGEKERGTLETLLSSPAARGEIVWGKLLTIITFSMATSLLNLGSMGLTGSMFLHQLQGMGAASLQIGPPPWFAILWLVVALVPISALFSAVALAIAAFARSTKEGQYYLMPMLVITLPLMLLPMMPSTELDLGRSLIPITGMMLLLQEVISGNYANASRYVLPVMGVTCVCCWIAIRWAIRQFNDESVLFRESERWDVKAWVRHMIRDRGETPGVSEAVLCGILLLLIRFYAGSLVGVPDSWNSFAIAAMITLVALIATPAALMAIMLTRNPRATLMLKRPRWAALPMAVLLAIVIHPAAMAFADGVKVLYPVSDQVAGQLQQVSLLINDAPNIWAVLFIIAVVPAVCEELAFRGFILSGLRTGASPTNVSSGSFMTRGPLSLDKDRCNKWVAILVSSFFFGITHGILQQSIAAFGVGLIIGYVAVQTGSIWPCILFHLTYNSMSVLMGLVLPELVAANPMLELFFDARGPGISYQGFIAAAGGAMALGILLWFRSLTRPPATSPSTGEAESAALLAVR